MNLGCGSDRFWPDRFRFWPRPLFGFCWRRFVGKVDQTRGVGPRWVGGPNPERWGPEGLGPKGGGARRVGSPTFRALFFTLPPQVSFFLPSLGCLLVDLWPGFEAVDHPNCAFLLLCGHFVEAPAACTPPGVQTMQKRQQKDSGQGLGQKRSLSSDAPVWHYALSSSFPPSPSGVSILVGNASTSRSRSNMFRNTACGTLCLVHICQTMRRWNIRVRSTTMGGSPTVLGCFTHSDSPQPVLRISGNHEDAHPFLMDTSA